MSAWVETTISLLSGAAVISLLVRGTSQRPVADKGMLSFRLHWLIGLLGYIALAISIFMLVGFVLGINEERWGLLAVYFVMFMLFAWIGSILVRDTFFYHLLCNDDVVILLLREKPVFTAKWNELVSGRVNLVTRYIIIRTADGRYLRLSPWLKGGDHLIAIMERKTQLPMKRLVTIARGV